MEKNWAKISVQVSIAGVLVAILAIPANWPKVQRILGVSDVPLPAPPVLANKDGRVNHQPGSKSHQANPKENVKEIDEVVFYLRQCSLSADTLPALRAISCELDVRSTRTRDVKIAFTATNILAVSSCGSNLTATDSIEIGDVTSLGSGVISDNLAAGARLTLRLELPTGRVCDGLQLLRINSEIGEDMVSVEFREIPVSISGDRYEDQPWFFRIRRWLLS
ncbi:hypothetical protein [Rugamonas apoptosis]|uniref:Uncharacterized protein n=1 Tax=Rugamonas apoptosis TaxID=2758570 RepID=A0A7W2IM62_9BURK|nr:hypothetical protein [Rugamonas apoptosis]MBA5689162.1 hypothetical protein [Rugamonas apoptosis]